MEANARRCKQHCGINKAGKHSKLWVWAGVKGSDNSNTDNGLPGPSGIEIRSKMFSDAFDACSEGSETRDVEEESLARAVKGDYKRNKKDKSKMVVV